MCRLNPETSDFVNLQQSVEAMANNYTTDELRYTPKPVVRLRHPAPEIAAPSEIELTPFSSRESCLQDPLVLAATLTKGFSPNRAGFYHWPDLRLDD
jgi:hypothetical protein